MNKRLGPLETMFLAGNRAPFLNDQLRAFFGKICYVAFGMSVKSLHTLCVILCLTASLSARSDFRRFVPKCPDWAADLIVWARPNRVLESHPAFENEPEIVRRRFVSKKDVLKVRRLMARQATAEAQAEVAFEYYLNNRLRGYSESIVAAVRQELADRKESIDERWPSVAGSTAVDELDADETAIIIQSHPSMYRTGYYFSILAHEVEHSLQRLDPNYALGDNKEWRNYFREFGAIRAEFDYWALIPEELRVQQEELAEKLADVESGKNETLGKIRASRRNFGVFRDSTRYSSFAATQTHFGDLTDMLFRTLGLGPPL